MNSLPFSTFRHSAGNSHTRGPEQSQVAVDLESDYATDQIHVEISELEQDIQAPADISSPPKKLDHSFWGLSRPIADIQHHFNELQGRKSTLNQKLVRQLASDIETHNRRAIEDQQRNQTRSQTREEVRLRYESARLKADTTNKLMFNGGRDLYLLTGDSFNKLNYDQHRDQYFITSDDGHLSLHYVDASGSPQLIEFQGEKRRLFETRIEELSRAGNLNKVSLNQDEFDRLITIGSSINNDPRTGHYNTSISAQNRRSERIRQAEFAAYRASIESRFTERQAWASKTNWLVDNGARRFHVIDNLFDLEGLDKNKDEGDYVLLLDTRTFPFQYHLYLFQAGQYHAISIPEINQAFFQQTILETVRNQQHFYWDKTFTLDHTEFVSIISDSTMQPDRPETAHFNSSRAAQQLRADRIRSHLYQQHWEEIGQTLKSADKAASKTNSLLYNSERTLQIVSSQALASKVPAEHSDEYFVVQSDQGQDREFTLYYISPSGQLHAIPIRDQQQFNKALGNHINQNNQQDRVVLNHQDFVKIVTNNSLLIKEGDTEQDQFVENTHFSTSIEAQRLKDQRMRAVGDTYITQCIAEELNKLDEQVAQQWAKREYFRATLGRIDYVASLVSTKVILGGAQLLSDISRNMEYLAEDAGSLIARPARRIAPYLIAGLRYGKYGLERSPNLVGRFFYVPLEYVGSRFTKAVRWSMPYLNYTNDYLWYRVNKATNGIARCIAGTGSAVCRQLGRAYRWVNPRLSQSAAWAQFAVSNAIDNASRSISRRWVDLSLRQYFVRVEAEEHLFARPLFFSSH